jgi:cytochrome c oxidase cbb3-type subunit 3
MPAFGRDQMLDAAKIDDLTEYVVALSHRKAGARAVARAAPIFAEQCVACHGAAGEGVQALGAPNLTDSEWLYGSTREAIRDQIWNGHGGVMPTWAGRFSPETIKALAVYVHVNAGGEAAPSPVAQK